MTKACLAFAFFCFSLALPLHAFEWESVTANGREYVTLHSFCTFYAFPYEVPSGNEFQTHSPQHTIRFKVGSPDMYLDGVHYVMSFPIESGDHDLLVSRMDVIKLFEPVLRPTDISGRHSIRGVVIDAGHGGSDNGAVSARGGMEKDYTRDTAFRLESILRGQGLKTVLTRRSDVFVDLYERAHIASLYPDYAFVSIHYNSATPEARGLETYCLSPRGAASTSSAYLTRSDIQKLPGNDYDPANILLASMVHSEIIKLNPGDTTADRGIKRARFVVIKQNVLPAILVEGGFVSNRMEAAQINTTGYRQRLAEAIARGVIKFVNVMGGKKMPMPESVPDESAAPSKAAAITPPAPSGLAKDSPVPKSTGKAVASPDATPKPALATAVAPKTKKGKTKKAVVTTASPSSTNVSTTVQPDAGTPSGPLNLSEPATPTPSPEADKASAEPDEPPVVNIYPTTAAKPSGGADSGVPTVSTLPPVSTVPKSGTNAVQQPASPSPENP
jgi:N-acetylmuramoyl-L-alanine amidase